MGRRSDHSREEIHQLALAAAEQLINEGGYKALSARKIAAAIGYTVGTLYLVFDNLDDLIFQLNGRTLEQLYQHMQQHVDKTKPGKPTLYALANAYIDYANTHTPRWNLLFEYVVDKNDQLPDWYMAKLDPLFQLVENALAQTVSGKQQRTLHRAARILWASVHGICLLKIRQRMDLAAGQSTEQMARILISHFIDGLEYDKNSIKK